MMLIKTSAHDTGLPAQSVHTVITSPPYFGLRSYDGDQAIEWPSVEYAPMPGLPTLTVEPMTCGLGEEPTPEAFIGHMVLVMREMWRVLRDDGTAWVNLGDSFAGSWGNYGARAGQQRNRTSEFYDRPGYDNTESIRPATSRSSIGNKNKLLMPHRFALAMQAEGWIVRQDNVWAKGVSCLPNYAGSCMPESVTDRPSTGHEYVFLLAKSQRYFYDNEAVKEAAVSGANGSTFTNGKTAVNGGPNLGQGTRSYDSTSRNLRSVWVLNPGSYKGAHFATFPERLPNICILAGTSAKGVCPECGAQWKRVVERRNETRTLNGGKTGFGSDEIKAQPNKGASSAGINSSKTTGWLPTCYCDAAEPVPATVLDPFSGSGTTGLVALRHNRRYIGIDLSDEYFEQTRQRFATVQPMLPLIG